MTHDTVPTPALIDKTTRKPIERRGLFAAAWAAIAALILSKTTQPVEAAAGMMFQDTAGGGFVNNSAGGPTAVYSSTLYTSTSGTLVGYAFQGSATAGVAGINGSGSAIAPIRAGVYGIHNKTTGASVSAGVLGENASSNGIGILGRSGLGNTLFDGNGVQGESGGGFGVFGQIPSGDKNAIAVYGLNQSTHTGGAPGAGGFGAYGYSARGHGLVGATGVAGGAAVVGATNGVAGAYAGTFFGPMAVVGSLTVTGAKSAAVPHEDGSHRLVYCVESPESWFEDFGKGQLACGQTEVAIDPNFAAIADMDDYHVFVTAYDRPNDLIISQRTPRGFRVETRDASKDAAFSWRLVARRKDITGERLAKVTIPSEPKLPALPAVAHVTATPVEVPIKGRGTGPQGV